MNALRRPKRRGWGWLVAIAYLLGCLSPSLAIPLPVDLAELSVRCAHEAHEFTERHQYSHADAASAVHSDDVAISENGHADQDRHADRHATCCGSALCFSAVSPQAPSLLQFAAPRSICGSEPDWMGDEGAFGRLYRPPIA